MIDYNDQSLWGAGNFFQFATPGDKISGNLVEVTYKTFEAKDDKPAQTVPVFHLEQNDGTVIEVTISYVDLKKQIREMQPQVGDFVGIKYTRKIDKTMLFDVVKRGAIPAGTTRRDYPVDAVPTKQNELDASTAELAAAFDQEEAPF